MNIATVYAVHSQTGLITVYKNCKIANSGNSFYKPFFDSFGSRQFGSRQAMDNAIETCYLDIAQAAAKALEVRRQRSDMYNKMRAQLNAAYEANQQLIESLTK